MQNLTPILGVIYDFNHDDLYFGHLESKAFLNQIEIAVSNYSEKSQSTSGHWNTRKNSLLR